MLQWPGTRVLFCWRHSTTSQGMQGSGREGESTANPGMSTDLAQPTQEQTEKKGQSYYEYPLFKVCVKNLSYIFYIKLTICFKIMPRLFIAVIWQLQNTEIISFTEFLEHGQESPTVSKVFRKVMNLRCTSMKQLKLCCFFIHYYFKYCSLFVISERCGTVFVFVIG